MFCFSRHYPFYPGHTSVRFHPSPLHEIALILVLTSLTFATAYHSHLPITHTYSSLTLTQTLPLLGPETYSCSGFFLPSWISLFLLFHCYFHMKLLRLELSHWTCSFFNYPHFVVISSSPMALNSMYELITLKFLFPFKISPTPLFYRLISITAIHYHFKEYLMGI